MKGFYYQKSLRPSFKAVKFLLLITVILTASAIAFEKIFIAMGFFTPYELFSLSTLCFSKYFIWQPLTYSFLQPAFYGLSFGFLISFGFQLYLLWMIGNSITQKKGAKGFLTYYFISAIFTAIALIVGHFTFGLPLLYSGASAMTYSLLIAWTILNAGARLQLLFAIPFKATSLVLGLLAFHLITDLASGSFSNVVAYLSAAFFGYFYTVIVWKETSPFPKFAKIEKFLTSLFYPTKSQSISSKIFDIQTGKAIVNDKTFFHAALARVSLKGKKSLSWKERWRLYRLSKKFQSEN